MRIDDDATGIGRAARAPTAAAGPATGRRADGTRATAGDRITLSVTTRELASLRHAVGPLDDVSEDRIAAIRPAVAAGAYRVEPPLVAQSLLVEELGALVA